MKVEHDAVIVVKRRKPHARHHGGAWKVAYADFVTAMMAFFLVMWLVTQSKEIRGSVAGYFRDPGVFQYQHSRGLLPGGKPGAEPGQAPQPAPKPDDAEAAADRERLVAAADRIRKDLQQTPDFGELRDQIELTVTTEGLRIELVERSGSSFFDSGSTVLRGESVRILSTIARELGSLKNDLVVEGHTDSQPYANGDRYGNWELSADRANASRRELISGGMPEDRMLRVQGLAASSPFDRQDPLAPTNRRISIIVMNREAEDRFFRTAPDTISAEGNDAPANIAPAIAPQIVGR